MGRGAKSISLQPMPDGAIRSPGGWSRFVLIVDDLESVVSRLTADGVRFRNDIVENFRDANRFSVWTLPVTSSSASSLRRLSCPNGSQPSQSIQLLEHCEEMVPDLAVGYVGHLSPHSNTCF